MKTGLFCLCVILFTAASAFGQPSQPAQPDSDAELARKIANVWAQLAALKEKERALLVQQKDLLEKSNARQLAKWRAEGEQEKHEFKIEVGGNLTAHGERDTKSFFIYQANFTRSVRRQVLRDDYERRPGGFALDFGGQKDLLAAAEKNAGKKVVVVGVFRSDDSGHDSFLGSAVKLSMAVKSLAPQKGPDQPEYIKATIRGKLAGSCVRVGDKVFSLCSKKEQLDAAQKVDGKLVTLTGKVRTDWVPAADSRTSYPNSNGDPHYSDWYKNYYGYPHYSDWYRNGERYGSDGVDSYGYSYYSNLSRSSESRHVQSWGSINLESLRAAE